MAQMAKRKSDECSCIQLERERGSRRIHPPPTQRTLPVCMTDLDGEERVAARVAVYFQAGRTTNEAIHRFFCCWRTGPSSFISADRAPDDDEFEFFWHRNLWGFSFCHQKRWPDAPQQTSKNRKEEALPSEMKAGSLTLRTQRES